MLHIPIAITDPVVVICDNCHWPFSDLINTVLLITKQYIYATKCLKEELSFMVLAQKLYEMQNLERIVTLRNNRYMRFVRKWSLLIE